MPHLLICQVMFLIIIYFLANLGTFLALAN